MYTWVITRPLEVNKKRPKDKKKKKRTAQYVQSNKVVVAGPVPNGRVEAGRRTRKENRASPDIVSSS